MSEKNQFELNQYERDALAVFIGHVVRFYLPVKEVANLLKELQATLTTDEINQLVLTYDFLEDRVTYPVVKSHQMKTDMPILKKILKWVDEHEMFDDNLDLIDAAEKILNY